MPVSAAPVGFVGLGNMGGPMAERLVNAGYDVLGYDAAGTKERIPVGAAAAETLEELIRGCPILCLSLPDGSAVQDIVAQIARAKSREVRLVVDFSTIGINAAQGAKLELARVDVAYLDAPVSGGVSGAAAGTLAIMAAGPRGEFDKVESLLGVIGKNVFYMGGEAGQGQAMKLLNNFLSATALVATSEAILFGRSAGLDMALMLDVLNASSGRNTATSDKFPQRVATGTFDAGFGTNLMAKDVALYREGVHERGSPTALCDRLAVIWKDAAAVRPRSDFTEIYQVLGGSAK